MKMGEGKLHCSLIMALVLTSLSKCEETQDYLQNAVRSLRNSRDFQTLRRADLADLKSENTKQNSNRRSHQFSDEVPPLSLTKGELAALYESAVSNGHTIKLDTGESEYVHAAVHHLDEEDGDESHLGPPSYNPQHEVIEGDDDKDGYYYYYYPIKSFLDEITSQPSGPENYQKPHHYHKELTTHRPPFQYHSHHHQHNVTIQTEMEKKDAKPMEPLFMAISGFIGMAVMYVISMIVLPKFEHKPNKLTGNKKKERLDDLARLAMNAIEGHCAERFACELTKTARTFHIEENRFYKLFRRIAPGTFGRYMDNAGKYSNKQLKCTAIPCIKKKPTTRKPPTYNQKKKNNAQKKH